MVSFCSFELFFLQIYSLLRVRQKLNSCELFEWAWIHFLLAKINDGSAYLLDCLFGPTSLW